MNRQGVPFGNALADNARFIRERLDIYANFRPSVVLALPQPVQAAPPANNPVIGGVYSRKTKRLDTVNHPGSLLGMIPNVWHHLPPNPVSDPLLSSAQVLLGICLKVSSKTLSS